jgi:hypothetical protein
MPYPIWPQDLVAVLLDAMVFILNTLVFSMDVLLVDSI